MSSLPALVGLVIALALVLVLPGRAEVTFLEVKELSPSHRQDSGHFGGSVSVSGDTAVVGACCENGGRFRAGAAYVFGRDAGGAGNWGEVNKLTASDGQPGDRFGSGVSVSGDTAVVGAGSGAAYVFQRDEGGADNWGEVKKLTAADPQGAFGGSVAVSGDTAVVGAGGWGSNAAAYVFERDEGGADNWGEVKKLVASDIQASDRFGWNVAVSGDIAVVAGSGSPVVFQRDQGGIDNWGEVKKFTLSGAGADHRFASFAVSSDTAVSVANRVDARGLRIASAAYVFQRDEGGADNWGDVKKLTFSDPQAVGFGDVAVSGDTAVVLTRLADAAGIHPISAHAFERDEGGADGWGEVARFNLSNTRAGGRFSDELFNSSVTVSGATAVVGVGLADEWGIDAGAAYAFQRAEGGADSLGLSAAVVAGIVAAVVAGVLYGPRALGQRRSEG